MRNTPEDLITKSDFLLYLEAPMHLWADKNGKLEVKAPSAYDQHLMRQGYEVEKLAQSYIDSVISKNYGKHKVLWQETYVDGNFEAKTDAMIFDDENKVYDLYEIKSSTSVDKEHLYDVTFQTLVCEKNVPIRNIFIVHLNKEYVRKGELDIPELFVAENVNEGVNLYREEVKLSRLDALITIKKPHFEGILDCVKPDKCPCVSLCHPNLPSHSIYEVALINEKKVRELKEDGILAIVDIPEGYPITPRQLLQVEAVKNGEATVDNDSIKKELTNYVFPLYFLDYESYNAAVTLYDGYKPYQHMVFQYSLHIIEASGGEIKHEEYLATRKGDPARALAEHLKMKIGNKGTILVWNKTFEEGRNKEMAEMYPEHKDFFLDVNARMCDLANCFQKNFYVHPEFCGKWSIKNVLPVMVPELTYDGLDIAKGDEAMTAWWEMVQGLAESKREETTKSLLKYCELDTYAMYKIWTELQKVIH